MRDGQEGERMGSLSWDELLRAARSEGADSQPPMKWKPEHWLHWLKSDGSSFALSALEDLSEKFGDLGLSRADVIELADRARIDRGDDALRFLLGAMLWGYSVEDGRGPYRVARMTRLDDVNERILAVLDALAEQGARPAYRLIQNRRKAGLPWLGASLRDEGAVLRRMER
jgi:uncharacterized protein YjiS (DUF1127 family)